MYKAGPEVSRGLYRARLLAVLSCLCQGEKPDPDIFFFPLARRSFPSTFSSLQCRAPVPGASAKFL